MSLDRFVSDEGELNYGQIVRFWRKHVLGWKSAQILVDLYNEQAQYIQESEISIRWWQRMEQFNQVPIDQRRRRLIQVLLGIPPAYLGLTALAPLSIMDESVVLPAQSTSGHTLDLRAYQQGLTTYWRSRETKKPPVFAELLSCVGTLEQAVLYGPARQRDQATSLLCHYLIVAGNACRYQGHMKVALNYLERALALAREREYDDLLLKALYIRGFTKFNRWTNWPGDERDADLTDAMNDFAGAFTLLQHSRQPVSAALSAAILADGGRASSYQTQDRQDALVALRQIDQAGKLMHTGNFVNDEQFLHIDQEWYHIDKAEALIAAGMPGLALEELDYVYSKGDPQARQRYFYVIIIEAEAYLAKGWGDVAAVYLDEALQSLNKTNSRRHFAHIVRLHQALQNSRFLNSPDVARLGANLLRFQHPEIFL